MKASEMIQSLQELIDKHGDLECETDDGTPVVVEYYYEFSAEAALAVFVIA